MQSSNIPSKIPLPFANAAGGSYVNTIPVNSQIGIVNGRASLADGFPPLTFTPIASGGVPPFGSDMNGILKEITSIQQWQEAGGFFPFDASFAATIGGYPAGAIIQSSNHTGLWLSTIENNSNNPDTGGAGWSSLAFEGTQSLSVTSADVTVTQLQSAYPILIISGALTGNRSLILPATIGEWIIQNNTTGAYTLTAKTPSGTGVTLTQGQSTYIYGDGTNIYFADSAKVASFNGRTGTVTLNATDVVNALGYTPGNIIYTGSYYGSVQYNTTTTLTVADVGRLTVAGASGSVFTLPLASTVPVGGVIKIQPEGGAFTVQPQGGNSLWANSGTVGSIAFGGDDSIELTCVSSTGWMLSDGNSQLPYSPFFANSKVTNGYQKLPSGLIMQWGIRPYDGTTGAAGVTYPIAFPNACLNIQIIGISYSVTGCDIYSVGDFNQYNFVAWGSANNDTAAGIQFHWVAIGY